MQRKLVYIFALLLFFIVGIGVVDAKSNQYSGVVNTNTTSSMLDSVGDDECNSVLGDPKDKNSFAYFLNEIFNVIKYLGPLLCVIFSILEFVKAVPSQDKDLLTKAAKKTVIRVILAIVLFFTPVLINLLFDKVLGWYGTCGIK